MGKNSNMSGPDRFFFLSFFFLALVMNSCSIHIFSPQFVLYCIVLFIAFSQGGWYCRVYFSIPIVTDSEFCEATLAHMCLKQAWASFWWETEKKLGMLHFLQIPKTLFSFLTCDLHWLDYSTDISWFSQLAIFTWVLFSNCYYQLSMQLSTQCYGVVAFITLGVLKATMKTCLMFWPKLFAIGFVSFVVFLYSWLLGPIGEKKQKAVSTECPQRTGFSDSFQVLILASRSLSF